MTDEPETPPADPPAGDPPSDPPAGDPPAGDPPSDPPAIHTPEGMPDHLRGESDQETIDKLYAAYAPLRAEQSKGKPEKVEDYAAVEFSDEFKAGHGNLEERDSDTMTLVREVALETGMPTDVFAKFVPALLERAVSGGLIEKPLSIEGEHEKAGGAENYQRRLSDLDQKFEGLKAQGKFTDEEVAEAKLLYVTADGLSVVEKIFALAAERGVDPGGSDLPADLSTKEQVLAAMEDERYDSTSQKYDTKFVERVRAAARKLL